MSQHSTDFENSKDEKFLDNKIFVFFLESSMDCQNRKKFDSKHSSKFRGSMENPAWFTKLQTVADVSPMNIVGRPAAK
jgi:hypothetical protein